MNFYNFRYCTKPTELIVQSLPPNDCDVSAILRNLILTKKHFLLEHRYDPFEIYSDEFEDELKAIPDPKKEPIDCLDQFLCVLDEFGPWCADRAALNLIAQIEKSKIKTPYERHYLLLCLVSTTLIQIRAFCEQTFQRFASEKECIETYSSPKALRLLNILRQFKPDKPSDANTIKQTSTSATQLQTEESNKINKLGSAKLPTPPTISPPEQQTNAIENGLPGENASSETVTEPTADCEQPKVIALTKMGKTGQTFAGGKKTKSGFTRPLRQFNHGYQNDPNALCGLLLCNSVFTAKVLFSFIYEMTKHDSDLEYLSVQYTGDRMADPVTESKQFENEHRKQEEVLKRFRMHTCNLLIGTSVLEEGIELPKCNLVIRWNLPTTYRSYVQCKGRARAQLAFHIIMVAANAMHNENPVEFLSDSNHKGICSSDNETSVCYGVNELKKSLNNDENDTDDDDVADGKTENCENAAEQSLVRSNFEAMTNETENIVKLIAQYMQIERILLKKCSNQEPTIQDLSEADLYTDFVRPYKPIKSLEPNAPFVNLATAVVLINKYCAKLPSDTFTKLTPLWRCCKTYRGNKEYFQYTVRLPINSPVKQDIYVSNVNTKCYYFN